MGRVGDAVRAVFRAVAFEPDGFGDATAPSRYVGGTVSGAPTTGDFEAGDYVIAQDGAVWVCSVAGSPGTWLTPATAAALTALTARVAALEAAGPYALAPTNHTTTHSHP
jgi:hypothetical protein